MSGFTPRKPDMRLCVKSPDGQPGTVGAAWIRDDGSLLVKLNPGTVLAWNDGLIISLFSAEEKKT